MSDDERINSCRRRLYPLVDQTLGRLVIARALLDHKANISPTSAEAQAHRVIVDAIDAIQRWTIDAGELVNVDTGVLRTLSALVESGRQSAVGSGQKEGA